MSEVVTYSIKLEAVTRDRLQALVDGSGVTAKEFLGRMVDFYEAAQTRESMGQVKEIESLRHHLARIEEIYVGLVKAGQDRQAADAAHIVQLRNEATQVKATALEVTEKAQTTAAEAAVQVETAWAEASAQVQAAKAEAARVHEAAEKDVRDARDALARAREAQQQAVKLAALEEDAAGAAKAKCTELESLAAQAEEFRQEAEQARKEAGEARDALRRATDTAKLEQDRAVLDVRTEGVKTREELARVREEKAVLEIQIARLKEERSTNKKEKKDRKT